MEEPMWSEIIRELAVVFFVTYGVSAFLRDIWRALGVQITWRWSRKASVSGDGSPKEMS